MALQAATVARELVMAAEQLANNGTLPREERFDWVYRQLKRSSRRWKLKTLWPPSKRRFIG